MNITLSADEKLIARAREYAQANDTTLNQMLRDYMDRVTGQVDRAEAAARFQEIARTHAGRSSRGYRFNRNSIHSREADE